MNPEWRFAMDCISEGRTSALTEATHLTFRMVCQALNYGLIYTHHADRRRSGYIRPVDARAVLAAWDSAPEMEPGAALPLFMQPHSVKPEGSALHWPINVTDFQMHEANIWGLIFGIERGWFAYDRAGFLQWSEAGRACYAAGDGGILIDKRGQAGFAF